MEVEVIGGKDYLRRRANELERLAERREHDANNAKTAEAEGRIQDQIDDLRDQVRFLRRKADRSIF